MSGLPVSKSQFIFLLVFSSVTTNLIGASPMFLPIWVAATKYMASPAIISITTGALPLSVISSFPYDTIVMNLMEDQRQCRPFWLRLKTVWRERSLLLKESW